MKERMPDALLESVRSPSRRVGEQHAWDGRDKRMRSGSAQPSRRRTISPIHRGANGEVQPGAVG